MPASLPYSSGRSTPRPSETPLSRLELRCPPLPQTLIEAMDLIDDPERLEVEPVTKMVQRDPIVVARLLHVVNSAYYGLRSTISSADRAVIMLGPVAVAGIVMGMNMMKLRSILDGPAAPCFQRLIRHSLATAFLTRHLVEGNAHSEPIGSPALRRLGVSFTAGLLHDFGKIILVYNFPERAVTLYERPIDEQDVHDDDLCTMEQLLFGCDHTEAGEYVARKLNFPAPLIDVIRLHHQVEQAPVEAPDAAPLVRAAAAANVAARTLDFAFTQPLDEQECLEHPVWAHLCVHDAAHRNPEAIAVSLLEQRDHVHAYVDSLVLPVVESGTGRSASNPFPAA